MKTGIFLTDWEIRTIKKALVDYEESNYESQDETWQKRINLLMETIEKKGKETWGPVKP